MTSIVATVVASMAVAVGGRNVGGNVRVIPKTAIPKTTIPIASIRGLCLSLPLVESVSSVAITVSGVGTACDSEMVRTGGHHSGGVRGSDSAVVVGD
jgi:hypothetical protein